MARGGYRKPRKPASVSGPGKYSRRTDGGPTNAINRHPGQKRVMQHDLPDPKYGEGKAFREMQQAAPMGGGQAAPRPQAPMPVDRSGVTPLSAPSMRPDEPVTNGSALGAGLGPEALGINPNAPMMDEATRARMQSWLPVLLFQASRPGSSPEFRQFVRQLRGDLL